METFNIYLAEFDLYATTALSTVYVEVKFNGQPPQPVMAFIQRIFDLIRVCQNTGATSVLEPFTHDQLAIFMAILESPIAEESTPGESIQVTNDMNRILVSRNALRTYIRGILDTPQLGKFPFPIKMGRA